MNNIIQNIIFAIITIIVIFSSVSVFGQQDTRYSQFMLNGMRVNPAYSGVKETTSLTAFYRNQWTQIDGAPQQISIGINDAFGRREKVGLGLMFEHDKIGVDQRTNLFASYAYKIPLQNGILSAGIQGGATFFRSMLTQIETPEGVYDDSFSEDRKSVSPNFGAGVLYYNKDFYLGFSVPHLLTYQKESKNIHEEQRLRNNYMEFMLTTGASFEINEDLDFRPNVLLQYIPAEKPIEISLNASLVIKDQVWFGATYRSNEIIKPESINFQAAYKMDNGVKVGYAYDLTLKGLGYYTAGTHEVMVGFDLNSKETPYQKVLW